jgi:hypothetical protein
MLNVRALDELDLAGAFAQALAANVGVSFEAVDEDEQGLTLGLDTRLRPIVQNPNAVDLAASLLVPGPIPAFGPLTPSGEPYDLGLCLSSTLLNQILKLQIEGGLLALDLTAERLRRADAAHDRSRGHLLPHVESLPGRDAAHHADPPADAFHPGWGSPGQRASSPRSRWRTWRSTSW